MATDETKIIPLDEDVLGFCTECIRVRWLRVLDLTQPTVAGTCCQCAREAEEAN